MKVGAELQMEVREGALVMLPSKRPKRVRYSLAQLLEGATPASVKALKLETAWAREGDAQGRELAGMPGLKHSTQPLPTK